MRQTTKNWIAVFVLLVALAFLLWPLFRTGFYTSDDGEWMVIRLTAFYQSLSQGQFPVRWLSRLNYSYGYPVVNFLYPGFLYIGAVLHGLGLSYVLAIKVILGMSVTATVTVLYFTLKKKWGQFPGLVGAVSFLYSPYLAYDVYKRGSVGEVLAFFPAALLFYAVQTSKYWIIPGAVAFLIISHNTLALLFLGVFVLFAISLGLFKKLLYPIGIGIGIASFFWVPAIIERKYVTFDSVGVSDPSQYFITFENFIFISVPILLAAVFFVWKNVAFTKTASVCLLVIFFGLFLSTQASGFLWNVSLLRTFVQFPFRFLAIPALLGSFVVAEFYYKADKNIKVIYMIICLVVWGVSVTRNHASIEFINRPEGFYVTNEATTTVRDEYMPKWVRDYPTSRPVSSVELVSGDATIEKRTQNTQQIDLLVKAQIDTVLQINTIYYPGWGVTVDNLLAPVSYDNPKGLMWVHVPKGEHRVIAQFRETVSRFMADLFSFVSICIYLVSLRYLRKMV